MKYARSLRLPAVGPIARSACLRGNEAHDRKRIPVWVPELLKLQVARFTMLHDFNPASSRTPKAASCSTVAWNRGASK